MSRPLVSILTITYNHERYIYKAIESFVKQRTHFEFEIVIADDGSTDNNQKIIRKYKNQYPAMIKPILRKENLGANANFINALEKCKGKYIAICEGDDYWIDPYKLQKQVDFLEANPEYGMISTDITLIDEKDNAIADNNMVLRQRAGRKPDIDFFDLLDINLINTLTVCVRAELMKELVERVTNKNLWFVYDYWFWLNISLKSKIRISYDKTAAYRVHEGGISHNNKMLSLQSYYIQKDAIEGILYKNGTFNHNQKQVLINTILKIISKTNIRLKKQRKLLHFCIRNPFLFVRIYLLKHYYRFRQYYKKLKFIIDNSIIHFT